MDTAQDNFDIIQQEFGSKIHPEQSYSAEGAKGVAGARKRCSAAGLTGSERRACRKNIISKCGRKPLNRIKKQAWGKCAEGIEIEDKDIEKAEQEIERLEREIEKTGLSIGAKFVIGTGIVLIVGVITFMALRRPKQTPVVAG